MNTWDRCPQSPEDEHEWVKWFDSPEKYRGRIWSYGLEEWVKEPSR